MYPGETLDRLRFIKQAQTVGLMLHEIRELVGYQDQGGLKRCRHVRGLLRAKLVELQVKLTELEGVRNALSGYLEKCEQTILGAKTRRGEPDCPVIETLKRTHT